MKRILFLLFAVGLTANMTVMAGMSTSKVRKETRFLTDKMAYELSLSTQQYNDAYEINYDFIYSVRNIMDYVARGYEWALDDYYEALDIRNDDLRWVLSDAQYRRFLGAEYFYRPIYVTGGKWSFRVYINYPNRSLFYFGVPYHYRTYCGAHYRPHFHHTSYYRGRYTNFNHYSAPHRVRDQRVYHSYRRSDFGSVRFRPNTSTRPHNAPTRPGNSSRPGSSTTRPGTSRPSTSTRPDTSRPGMTTRPGTSTRPRPESGDRPSTSVRPSTSSGNGRPNKEVVPDRNGNTNRVEGDRNSGLRPETSSGSSSSNRRSTSGSSTSSGSNRESGKTSSSSRESSSRRNDSSGSYNRNNSSDRNNSSSSRGSSGRGSSSSVVVLPVAVVKILPAVAVVLPLAVVAVVRVLLEAAVALPGAMFPADKQKDALLPEVREVIALKALPVLLKETAVQEDNLFLYYLYQSHCSSAVGELDFGFSPARLFRASPVTWISGRILSASISLITPFCARRFAISL